MADLIETSDNGITTLTLNRPERLNALSPAMTEGLKEALERLSTYHVCAASVITGAGRGWCAGGDVKTMEARGRDQTVEDRAEGLRRSHQLPLLLRTMPKIVIASINGPVAGAGLGLALACDLRIAGRSARFGTAFARIGYSGDYGGSWSLTRLLGTAKPRTRRAAPSPRITRRRSPPLSRSAGPSSRGGDGWPGSISRSSVKARCLSTR